jgi:hypothetical protein
MLLGSWPIIVANGLTFALTVTVLSLKARETLSARRRSER